MCVCVCVCVPVCLRACVPDMYNSVHTQVLSGTGGGRVAFEFMARFVGKNTPIYMPDPTWANHLPMAKDAGLSLATYR